MNARMVPIAHEGLSRSLDGGSCVNQRSIKLAAELFSSKHANGMPLTLADLLEALWVLELLVVSNGISYDGTLPKKDLVEIEQDLQVLSVDGRLSSGYFSAISPRDDEEQLEFVVSSAAVALQDLSDTSNGQFGPLASLDKPLDELDAKAFFRKLQELRASAESSEDAILGRPELLALLSERYRGSKCVVGIAALGIPGIDQALALAAHPSVGAPLAAGMLINRFRFTYVRQLSFAASDAYVPAARWKDLSKAHAVTFHEVARRFFQERYASGTAEHLWHAMHATLGGDDNTLSVALPPIGLYVLMNGRSTDTPQSILANGLDLQASLGQLIRKFWQETAEVGAPEGGWVVLTGNHELDQHVLEIERVLSDRLGKLDAEAEGLRSGSPALLENYATPIYTAAAGAAGAALGVSWENIQAGAAAGAAAGAVAGFAVQFLCDATKQHLISHVDQYRALDAALLRNYAQVLRFDRLEARVAEVFGRSLLPG